jgi:hypothetical protein
VAGSYTDTWKFTVDTVPPTHVVLAAPEYAPPTGFQVSWSAQDEGSGIGRYDVDVVTDTPDAEWWSWLEGMTETQTQATFVPSASYVTYKFSVTAYDRAGNAGRSPEVATSVRTGFYLPLALHDWQVRWLWWYQYDVHEPNDSLDEARETLECGKTYTDTYIYVNTDEDYYLIEPSDSTTRIEVDLKLKHIPEAVDYDLYVLRDDGTAKPPLIARSDEYGKVNEHVEFSHQAGASYFVHIRPYAKASSSDTPYYLAVKCDE